MLLKLSIKNYILIHDLEIDFSDGFSVITGETGAGKSILLGALSLILGQRADSGSLLDKSRKCIIEGLFAIGDYNLESFFNEQGLDYDETVILRREIGQNGKSRTFINDTPVNLVQLKDLGDRLVNVHSQHSIVTLNDSNFQLAVIDSYAGVQADMNEYRRRYLDLLNVKRQLAGLEELAAKSAGEKDYLEFLYKELTAANLIPGELHDIEEELELLTHAEEVRSSLYQAIQMIADADENILSRLSETGKILNGISKYKPDLAVLTDRINSNYIDIKDVSKELAVIGEQVFVDPARVESLTQRLDLLYRLMKKHFVKTVEELADVRLRIEKQLSEVVGVDEQVIKLHNDIAALEATLLEKAVIISKERQKITGEFEKEVINILKQLGIGMARFNIEFFRSTSLTRDGIDKVKFLFSANKGIGMKELSGAASGGELSRLMLAMKSMISQKNLLPTIIFDEIDSGVSGETAGKVGGILKRMGNLMQVIAITHLPQIAAKGDLHYRVFKSERDHTASTYIDRLTEEERIGEIAKMLSNEKVTASALKTAKELLNN